MHSVTVQETGELVTITIENTFRRSQLDEDKDVIKWFDKKGHPIHTDLGNQIYVCRVGLHLPRLFNK